MKALEKSKTTLLEPILSFSITIAEELSGKIMSRYPDDAGQLCNHQ